MMKWFEEISKHLFRNSHLLSSLSESSLEEDSGTLSFTSASHDNRGVLYKEEIRKYQLIDPNDLYEKSLQTCSYDLRLGNKHYLFDDMGNLTPIFLGIDGKDLEKYSSSISNASYNLSFPSGRTDVLVIPAFGSAIIELMETVDTLHAATDHDCLIVGRFDLKLSAIYKGLISQQATQVEPCYRGKLYCFLHNLTAHEIELELGERVATIEFLYAGVSLSKAEIQQIVDQTKNVNQKKFKGEFAYEGEGIKDVRWLCSRGSLPRECGLAPINRKVNHNIEKEVQSFMEKDSTVEWYSERIGKRIDEHQGVVKLVLSLVIAAVSLIGVSFVTDVLAQLRYFEEQLSFFGDTLGSKIDSSAIAAMEAHTRSFDAFREALLNYTIIAVALVMAILLIYYFLFSESFWARRQNRLAGKSSFLELRKKYRASKIKAVVKTITVTWAFVKALPKKFKKSKNGSQRSSN